MTLYIFTPDSAGTSTCVDPCARSWPPFTVAAADTLQVALDGAPLCYYAADTKAGETCGQGAGGKWHVASPAGAAASPSSGGKPGY